MFSVTVRDHMMVAHSLRGEVFGPAQRLHGATYVVDATFRGAELDARRDRGRHRPGGRGSCAEVVGELGYRNLDDEPALAGSNTTTEVLAQVVADRLAERVRGGSSGSPVARVRCSRSRCTSPTSRGPATSGRCEHRARGGARGHRRPGTGRAAATPTTARWSTGSRDVAGWSRCTRWPAPGRLAGRAATLAGLRVVLGGPARRGRRAGRRLVASRRPRCWSRSAAGCGSSCSCTCARRRGDPDATGGAAGR